VAVTWRVAWGIYTVSDVVVVVSEVTMSVSVAPAVAVTVSGVVVDAVAVTVTVLYMRDLVSSIQQDI
jgi:hypothetical protein